MLAVLNAQRGVEVSNRTMLQNLMPLILTLGVSNWVTYSRMARSVTLSLREKEFVEAARALGDSKLSIMFRNILPNSLAPLIVLGSFNVASTILAEASLSFLGLGVPPAVPTWGGMLAESREMLITGVWWLATIPGLAIMITVISINIIGDWLRDFYDPRLRVFMAKLLEIQDKSVSSPPKGGACSGRGHLHINEGETLAVVGRVRLRQVVTARSIMRLIPNPRGDGGSIRWR